MKREGREREREGKNGRSEKGGGVCGVTYPKLTFSPEKRPWSLCKRI